MNPFLIELLTRILGGQSNTTGALPIGSGQHSFIPAGPRAAKPAAPMPSIKPIAPTVAGPMSGMLGKVPPVPPIVRPAAPPPPAIGPGQSYVGAGSSVPPVYPTQPGVSASPIMGSMLGGSGVPSTHYGSWSPFANNPNAEFGGGY